MLLLVVLMLLFNTDFENLKKSDSVEKVQLKGFRDLRFMEGLPERNSIQVDNLKLTTFQLLVI